MPQYKQHIHWLQGQSPDCESGFHVAADADMLFPLRAGTYTHCVDSTHE